MTYSPLQFLDHPSGLAHVPGPSLPLYAVRPEGLGACLAALPEAAAQARLLGFTGEAGRVLLYADAQGALAGALLGLGNAPESIGFGAAAAALPAGSLWHIEPGGFDPERAERAFLLGAYRYQTQRARQADFAQLAPQRAQAQPRARILAGSMMLARELINTPPNLLGPTELAQAALDVAQHFGAEAEAITGAALEANYPTVAAVGAGSVRAPAVVVLRWQGSQAGTEAKLVSLCGKGVCFDTGGYNLKPGGSMRLMRKDMGGAAIMLGLASAIMALDLPIRLELRLGCVENSVSGHAMRPSDILRTRAGISVEVGDTDAEGRLVLCDLLHEACGAQPHWLIDAATLTGAARVALGPDLPALFSNDDALAQTILESGLIENDPLWRLPLHAPYAAWLETPYADLCNISSKPMAGAVTAALFLQHFISKNTHWAHIDTYAWNDATRPGKPEGGEAQTLQALLAAIEGLSRPHAM